MSLEILDTWLTNINKLKKPDKMSGTKPDKSNNVMDRESGSFMITTLTHVHLHTHVIPPKPTYL